MKKIILILLSVIIGTMTLDRTKERSVSTTFSSAMQVDSEETEKYVQDLLPVIKEIILNDKYFLSDETKENLGELKIEDRLYYNGIYSYNIVCKEAFQFRIDVYKVGCELTFTIAQRRSYKDNTWIGTADYTPDFCVNQKDHNHIQRGMCWAASVATTMNFIKGTSLTAEEVCKEMEVPLDEGGEIVDKENTLRHYGIDYGERNNQLNWKAINKSISSGRPILISGFSADYTYGHAVTILDCVEISDNKVITIWDSGTEEVKIIPYDETVTTFSSSGEIYYWQKSLY